MKFSKLSRLFLVSSIGLLVAALFSACDIVTVDYVFVATSSGIDTYAVDSASGALRPVGAVVTSGVNSPTAMTVSTDYENLYVANAGDNSIVHYSIAMNGVLTLQKDNVSQTSPATAIAVNTAGSSLYEVYGSGGPGSIQAFALGSEGAIGASANPISLEVPGYTGDTIIPTGITVLANNATVKGNAVFVSAYDQSAYNPGCSTCVTSTNPQPGWVFGFTVASDGTLTPVAGSPWKAGVKPSAIAADPTNHYVYVTDFASSQLIGYSIMDGSTLALLPSTFKTGNEPTAVTIDPRGKFLYVANALDNTVSSYSIDLTTGAPTISVNVTGASNNSTGTEPVAVIVDPALGRFVLTANLLDNSVSGFNLNPTSGALNYSQASPYPTGQKPTALAAVPHGNHATPVVTP